MNSVLRDIASLSEKLNHGTTTELTLLQTPQSTTRLSTSTGV